MVVIIGSAAKQRRRVEHKLAITTATTAVVPAIVVEHNSLESVQFNRVLVVLVQVGPSKPGEKSMFIVLSMLSLSLVVLKKNWVLKGLKREP